MERLTERIRGHIRIKGCKTLYPDQKRKGAYLNNAIVQLCAYEDAQEQATPAKSIRLIDANALLFTTLTDGGHWSKDVVYKSDISGAPTIDPVYAAGGCYCRECRYHTCDLELARHWCNRTTGSCEVESNGFCSYGKRRKGKDNE